MPEFDGFENVQDIVGKTLFQEHSRSYHIPAETGDYIDEDGYLCCG